MCPSSTSVRDYILWHISDLFEIQPASCQVCTKWDNCIYTKLKQNVIEIMTVYVTYTMHLQFWSSGLRQPSSVHKPRLLIKHIQNLEGKTKHLWKFICNASLSQSCFMLKIKRPYFSPFLLSNKRALLRVGQGIQEVRDQESRNK